jgi:hypothetical protein
MLTECIVLVRDISPLVAVRGDYEIIIFSLHKQRHDEHSFRYKLKRIEHLRFNKPLLSCCFSPTFHEEMCCVVEDGTLYLWEGAVDSSKYATKERNTQISC